MKINLLLSLFLLFTLAGYAQNTNRIVHEQCGTMQRLQAKFENAPVLKKQFEERRAQFNKALKESSPQLLRPANSRNNSSRIIYTIPVVFHIVLTNPATVTDNQIFAQLETLNKDFPGINADSEKIPSYFKSLFGKSGIHFCLAQQTPDGESTSGIERITTTQASFTNDDAVKHTSSSGADIWNGDKYFNIWICALSNNLLGYATFPDDGIPNEQGVVVDYRTLPAGSFTSYNTGKTLTHETGHYFNLYHIWGDDDGACSGTDYVDDTPNQANSSSACYSGIKTDNCTTTGNGIMYQNYMDYTPDDCLIMFTIDQVQRMESTLAQYRSSLLTSNGCQPSVIRNNDVQLISINQPLQRLCTSAFTPEITIKNKGADTLTSLIISSRIDNGNLANYTWTGTLTHSAATDIKLNSLSTATGNHTLTVYVSLPNNKRDEDLSDDTLAFVYQYFKPVKNVSESFEGTVFPPEGWDIINPDSSITWKRVSGPAKTGNESVTVANYDYNSPGQKDYLRLPGITFTDIDSAFLSFNVAASAYTSLTTRGNNWDTLELLASTDCGQSYSSLYKKYGSSLVTTTSVTSAFVPSSNEWRKDSVNLANYIGNNETIFAFRNTNGHENNIYLDDINLRTVKINPNLKNQGFLVTPNPTTGIFAVQFYPQPVNLKAIQIINTSGQTIIEIQTKGQANNYYNLNIGNYPPGIYIVRAVFSDTVLTKKIVRL